MNQESPVSGGGVSKCRPHRIMMKQSRTVGRLLLNLASLVIIIAALKSISQLLAPILLSLFVVLIVYPIMLWLERRGMARWIAYTLVVLGVIVVGTIFIIFLAVSLTELSIALPKYEELLDARLDGLQQWLASHNLRIEDVLKLNWFNPQNIFSDPLLLGQYIAGNSC